MNYNMKQVYLDMLKAPFLSEYSMGALIGLEFTEQQEVEAEKRSKDFLEFLGFLPPPQDSDLWRSVG